MCETLSIKQIFANFSLDVLLRLCSVDLAAIVFLVLVASSIIWKIIAPVMAAVAVTWENEKSITDTSPKRAVQLIGYVVGFCLLGPALMGLLALLELLGR